MVSKNNLIDHIKTITNEKSRTLIYIDVNPYRFVVVKKTIIDLDGKYL